MILVAKNGCQGIAREAPQCRSFREEIIAEHTVPFGPFGVFRVFEGHGAAVEGSFRVGASRVLPSHVSRTYLGIAPLGLPARHEDVASAEI